MLMDRSLPSLETQKSSVPPRSKNVYLLFSSVKVKAGSRLNTPCYRAQPWSDRPREVTRGQPSGRTSEIQRLIGRCLRAVVDARSMGERTITIDCDVLQADAGTRVASICAGFVALYDALSKLRKSGVFDDLPITEHMAAVSIVQINGQLLLDPNYSEDSQAEMDSNIVLTESGKILELQMTSEAKPYDPTKLNDLMLLANKGIKEIIGMQIDCLNRR
jgi:ribonuclease PH